MVEVEYDGVTMEANALVGDAGIPTLANTARGALRVGYDFVLACRTGHSDPMHAHKVAVVWWLSISMLSRVQWHAGLPKRHLIGALLLR